MAHLLIVYGTTHGQTGKVVARLAERLEERGHEVTLWNADHLPRPHALTQFDLVVVAGSVHYGRYQRPVVEFVRWNLGRLNTHPSVFVSVCGALAGDWSEGKAEAAKYVEALSKETGWRPTVTRSFAGAVRYTDYGLFTRWIMKLISWRTGRPTDTSRDWEFTDWNAVDAFAAELAGRMLAPPPVTSAAAPASS